MNSRDIDPAILATLDEEREFVQSSGSRIRRVKIAKGHSLTVRWLPVELGSKKTFFARVFLHWINNRPYFCAERTHPDFGGSGERCHVCEVTDEYLASRDRNINSVGFRCGANPQWITYCLIFEKETQDGDVLKTKAPERWMAYEFPLGKNSFEDLLALYRRGLKRCPTNSIMDLVDGRDIIVTQKARDMSLEAMDPQPIANPDDPDKFQELVNKIWASIPPINFSLTEENADLAVDKINELVRLKRRGDDDSSRERHASGDDDDRPRQRRDDDEAPRRRSRDDDDDDDVPPPRQKSHDDDDDRPRRRRDDDEAPRGETPRHSRNEEEDNVPMGPATSPPSVAMTARIPPSVGKSLAPPPAARKVEGSPAAAPPAIKSHSPREDVPSSVEDADNVTDEQRDPAPLSKTAAEAEAETSPPPVNVPPQVNASLQSRLQRGIAAAKNRA